MLPLYHDDTLMSFIIVATCSTIPKLPKLFLYTFTFSTNCTLMWLGILWIAVHSLHYAFPTKIVFYQKKLIGTLIVITLSRHESDNIIQTHYNNKITLFYLPTHNLPMTICQITICQKLQDDAGLSAGESLGAPFGRKPLLVHLLQYCLS